VVELADRAALEALLREARPASFHREQVVPRPGGGFLLRTRVTPAEEAALARAGFRPVRLPDRERSGRRAVEDAWAVRGGKAAQPAFPLAVYPTHPEIGTILADLAAAHPAICDTFVWGTSVQGRELWGIRISGDVQATGPEPEVRLSSTIHGDEPVGMVMLLDLAGHLVGRYGQPGYEDVTALVDGTEIHIMPLHNPDGYAGGSRYNADGIDLNRNFELPHGTQPVRETETLRFMEYAAGRHFVVSLNGHGGSLVVNYPWDWTYDLTPDDAAIRLLSLEYSTRNLPMYEGPFDQGITNGAAWYPANGTLQDWSYDQTGCIDVTLEIGEIKWPPADQLPAYWEDNRASLMAYAAAAGAALRGVVTDAVTGAPLAATVAAAGDGPAVVTDPEHGDWYKLVPSGTWELTFTAAGHVARTVPDVTTVWGTPTVVDVALQPDTSRVPPAPVLALGAVPNPFNPGTTFTLSAPTPGRARLEIFDLRGRRVRTLWEGEVPAGETSVPWDGRTDAGRGAGAGTYLGRVTLAGRSSTVKVTLVR